MELKQAGDLQLAIDTLATLHRELGQLINPTTTTSQQARDAWLRWWAMADQRLRNAFADDDLVLPLYQSTAVIKSAAPPGSWRDTPAEGAHEMAIVLRERDIWVERLKSAEGQLHLIEGFVGRPGRVVVLDTSAFHEFDRFWLADWASVTEAKPDMPVRLVVPLVVVGELDSQKRHPSSKVRATARDVLRHLRELKRVSTDEVADVLRLDDRVTVEILLDPVGHIRLPDNDAEIIDRAQFLRTLLPSARRLILVTGDVSMEFRAESRALEVRHVSRPRPDDE